MFVVGRWGALRLPGRTYYQEVSAWWRYNDIVVEEAVEGKRWRLSKALWPVGLSGYIRSQRYDDSTEDWMGSSVAFQMGSRGTDASPAMYWIP